MPTKKLTADQIRQNLAAAKTKPVTGRTIGQNLKQTLDRVKSVLPTVGTGILQSAT